METLFYILLGAIVFIYQIYKETIRVKKDATQKRPDFNPEPVVLVEHPEERRNLDELQEKRKQVAVEMKRREEELNTYTLEEILRENTGVGNSVSLAQNKQYKRDTEIDSGEAEKDEHLEHYEIQYTEGNPYARMLKEPESLKSALIAGEIFKRRHF